MSASALETTAWAPKSATVTGDLSFLAMDSSETRLPWTVVQSLEALRTAAMAVARSVVRFEVGVAGAEVVVFTGGAPIYWWDQDWVVKLLIASPARLFGPWSKTQGEPRQSG